MKSVTVRDKNFGISLDSASIQKRVSELAIQISSDLKGQKPLFLCVLNGSFIFAADLFKQVTIEAEVAFIRVSSYEGTASTGMVKSVIGINEDLQRRLMLNFGFAISTAQRAHSNL